MKVVDLTQPMTNGMPVMDGITPPRFDDLAEVAADGYGMSEYAFINHTGTHIDAPVAPGRRRRHAGRDPAGAPGHRRPDHRRERRAAPARSASTCSGRTWREVQPGDIVLIRSGNAARWGTDAYWHGWCYPDAAAARALVAAGRVGRRLRRALGRPRRVRRLPAAPGVAVGRRVHPGEPGQPGRAAGPLPASSSLRSRSPGPTAHLPASSHLLGDPSPGRASCRPDRTPNPRG